MEYSNRYAPYSDGNPKRIPLDAVENYSLADYGFTIEGVKSQIFGVQVIDPNTGKELPDEYYIQAINSAVASAEKKFDIKILPRFIHEQKDFYENNYNSFNYLKLNSRPVLQVEQFSMNAYNQTLLEYPPGWWKVACLGGSIQLMPTLAGFMNDGIPFSTSFMGQVPLLNTGAYNNQGYAPQLFHVSYVAGMLPQSRDGVTQEWEMPPDLRFLILKESAKSVLEVWGRLIIGAGIASKSFDMDGISETIVTTQSAMYGGASADILQLNQDIAELTAGLKAYFGINIGII